MLLGLKASLEWQRSCLVAQILRGARPKGLARESEQVLAFGLHKGLLLGPKGPKIDVCVGEGQHLWCWALKGLCPFRAWEVGPSGPNSLLVLLQIGLCPIYRGPDYGPSGPIIWAKVVSK